MKTYTSQTFSCLGTRRNWYLQYVVEYPEKAVQWCLPQLGHPASLGAEEIKISAYQSAISAM